MGLKKSNAFTLIELLITLAIIGIVMGFAIPNLRSFWTRNQGRVLSNRLQQAIHYGRTVAILSNHPVTFCPIGDNQHCGTNWNRGQYLFEDNNRDRDHNSTEKLLRIFPPIEQGQLTWRGFMKKQALQFEPSGYGKSLSGRFTWCANVIKRDQCLAWVVNRLGRIRVLTS